MSKVYLVTEEPSGACAPAVFTDKEKARKFARECGMVLDPDIRIYEMVADNPWWAAPVALDDAQVKVRTTEGQKASEAQQASLSQADLDLVLAASQGREGEMLGAVARGAKHYTGAIHHAAACGQTRCLRVAMEMGRPLGVAIPREVYDAALRVATAGGHHDCVQLLNTWMLVAKATDVVNVTEAATTVKASIAAMVTTATKAMAEINAMMKLMEASAVVTPATKTTPASVKFTPLSDEAAKAVATAAPSTYETVMAKVATKLEATKDAKAAAVRLAAAKREAQLEAAENEAMTVEFMAAQLEADEKATSRAARIKATEKAAEKAAAKREVKRVTQKATQSEEDTDEMVLALRRTDETWHE